MEFSVTSVNQTVYDVKSFASRARDMFRSASSWMRGPICGGNTATSTFENGTTAHPPAFWRTQELQPRAQAILGLERRSMIVLVGYRQILLGMTSPIVEGSRKMAATVYLDQVSLLLTGPKSQEN
jgi:hypothetical protein